MGDGFAALEGLEVLSFWGGRSVLVTGATGVVGSWLVKELLAEGASVTALVLDPEPKSEFYRSGDSERTNVVLGRLQDLSTLERAINRHETDTVFHLGAQAIVGAAERAPLDTFESNIRGTYNLLEACRLMQGLVERIVVASSDKAYGAQKHLPYTETMSLDGRQPYEVSKSCADLIAQSYHHTYRLPVTVARCGNIFGGGDLNWSRIVPGTVRSLVHKERPVIRSDGRFTRDYIYVKDVVRAYMRLAERSDEEGVLGESFNFGPEEPRTVLDIVAAIQRVMGDHPLEPIILDTARGEIRDQYLSSEKAKERLGWRASFSLDEGLAETITWYRSFLAGRHT